METPKPAIDTGSAPLGWGEAKRSRAGCLVGRRPSLPRFCAPLARPAMPGQTFQDRMDRALAADLSPTRPGAVTA